jgi:hypothetical protein
MVETEIEKCGKIKAKGNVVESPAWERVLGLCNHAHMQFFFINIQGPVNKQIKYNQAKPNTEMIAARMGLFYWGAQ